MALLADDQAVVRVRPERFVRGTEPVRDPLGHRFGHRPIQPGADDEPRDEEQGLVVRLDPQGRLDYATLLGGDLDDILTSIDVTSPSRLK